MRWNIIDPKCHLYSACFKEQPQFRRIVQDYKKMFLDSTPCINDMCLSLGVWSQGAH